MWWAGFLPPNMSASDSALQYKVNFDAEHDGSSPSPYAILVCQQSNNKLKMCKLEYVLALLLEMLKAILIVFDLKTQKVFFEYKSVI